MTAPPITAEVPTVEIAPSGRRVPALLGFLVLLVAYGVLSFATSPDAYLSTDVGGKTAALAAMEQRNDWSVDIGYWADDVDPEGLAHPYANTSSTDGGWWVNTTSLPMVLTARPLWLIGGSQLILVLPMMAAAAAAVVAGRIQQRLADDGSNSAMWIVGLASPLTIYALDFWEHTIGVFLMALGALLVLEAADGDGLGASIRRLAAASGAGLAFGLAATMRQEALVYGFAAGLALTAALLIAAQGADVSPLRRLASLGPSLVMAMSALLVLVVHSIVETLYYGEPLRSTRSLSAAASAGAGLRERLDDAFTVTFSPVNAIHPVATVLGTILVVGLLWLVIAARSGRDLRRPALLLLAVALLLGLRVVRFGPSFVPGLVPTTPLAVAAVVLGWSSTRHRLVLAMALLPVPIVYATQYVGGAVPQWGGRYLLTTGLLLTVVACVELPRVHSSVFRSLIVASFLVTASGVWFTSIRTHSVAEDFELVAEVSQIAGTDVVVWFDPMKAREGGPNVIDRQWLSTVGGAEEAVVMSILEERSVDRFVFIDPSDDEPPVFSGFTATTETGRWQTSEILNSRLTVFERLPR